MEDDLLDSRSSNIGLVQSSPFALHNTEHNVRLRQATETLSDDVDDPLTDYEIFVCLYYRKRKLAAAVYFAETSEMHLMYDVVDLAPDFRLLCALFNQLQPTHVVTCPSLPDVFILKVHSLLTGEGVPISPTMDPPSYSSKLHFIPAKEFRYSTCKRSVLELRLPSEPENASESERHYYVMSVMDVSASVLVSAVGGLLYFMQRSLSRLTLTSVESPILAIHTLHLNKIVWVDEETIHALQIFAPTAHPSSFKWLSGGIKEGLSVFSLLNRCHSNPGTKYMRVMVSQPTRDVEVLRLRHEVISFCLKPINLQVVKLMTDSLSHVKSVLKILTRMTNAQASVAQWKAFYDTIYNSVLIGEVCKAHSKDVRFFQQVGDCLCDNIYIMSHCINRTMHFEISTLHNRIVIKNGICEELDHLKDKYSNLGVVMERVAEQELAQLPEYVESCSMVYIPEVGYLLALPQWEPDLTEEQLRSLPNLHYRFRTKSIIHYKSARCYELDNLLGDVQLDIIEIESKIVLKLVQYIQKNIAPLVKLTGLLAELDCLLALTQAARDYNLVLPTLTETREIHITKGRHVLQEVCVDVFVPNDTHSSEHQGLVKILSGPNASGKSVYLKQVALIVYMAHIGSFVPAERAVIPMIDQIHTRIQSAESVSTHISSFIIDLRQISLSVRNATANSLVLIDEFGKGTTEVDGLGILTACLEHFIQSPANCPHLFVSTHFHSLPKQFPPSPLVKFQHLDHIVEKGELVYLYALKEGVSRCSFALVVAEAHGLSTGSAERARQILTSFREAKEITAVSSSKQSQLIEKRRLYLKELSQSELDNRTLDKFKKCLESGR